MKLSVSRSALKGEISAVCAKAYAHRILICAALSDRPTSVGGLFPSEDIVATLSCLKSCGVTVENTPCGSLIIPPKEFIRRARFDCAESGSTLRFLLPVAAALGIEGEFIGRGRLPERPIGELCDSLKTANVFFDSDKLPLKISGRLEGSVFKIDGSASSQYVSGMLLALAALGGTRQLNVQGKRVSGSYIDITIDVLRAFGVSVSSYENGFTVTAPSKLRSPEQIFVEGDWSNSAFWLVAGVIGDNPIRVKGLNVSSVQGDRAIVDILKNMNADIVFDDGVTAYPSALSGCVADCSDCPDLMPILSVAAAFAEGTTVLKGADRLKIKECDRLSATLNMLRAADIECSYGNDSLIIKGGAVKSADFICHADHRMIMSAAILAAQCGGSIDDATGVKKSYPHFFEDFKALGGIYNGDSLQ